MSNIILSLHQYIAGLIFFLELSSKRGNTAISWSFSANIGKNQTLFCDYFPVSLTKCVALRIFQLNFLHPAVYCENPFIIRFEPVTDFEYPHQLRKDDSTCCVGVSCICLLGAQRIHGAVLKI